MDINKHIEYWRTGAEEEIEVAKDLLDKKRCRHALFFAHLALEKALKALVTKVTRDVPPRTHDLLRLAHLAQIAFSADHRVFLARIQEYCLEGRYPEISAAVPTQETTQRDIEHAREILQWLIGQLNKPSDNT